MMCPKHKNGMNAKIEYTRTDDPIQYVMLAI